MLRKLNILLGIKALPDSKEILDGLSPHVWKTKSSLIERIEGLRKNQERPSLNEASIASLLGITERRIQLILIDLEQQGKIESASCDKLTDDEIKSSGSEFLIRRRQMLEVFPSFEDLSLKVYRRLEVNENTQLSA